jgi:Phosphotransferase enzyme family
MLGALSPFRVDVPWWSDVGPIVVAARAVHGVEVTVLRLLQGEEARAPGGGPVTYLAEVDNAPAAALIPWPGDPISDEPLRVHYARPGGPDDDLRWADGILIDRGTPRTGPPEQVRTWNLSSLWRLPVDGSAAWLKVVPPFFAHESRMLAVLDPAVVPRLIAGDGQRILLEEIPAPDHYDTVGAPLLTMVRLLVGLQCAWIGRVDELFELGLPDWRPEPLTVLAADVIERTASELDLDTVRRLERLLEDLPRRNQDVASCGVPITLVHGDFHPGNVRGPQESLVLLDWGDCGVGHPLLDQAAFLDRMPESERAGICLEWSRHWRAAVPGCDPDRAARLLEPVAALRQAVIYRGFLDAIEPDERLYHAADPALWLARAARLAAERDGRGHPMAG